MKFSFALTAVFLPAFVNAQYGGDTPSSTSSSSTAAPSSASNSSTISVRLAFVIPSIFVDVPQVTVGAGGALAYSPSAITAANGTTVTFVFAQYNFPCVNCLPLQWCSHISLQERSSFRHAIYVRKPLHVPGSGQRLVSRVRFWSTDWKAVYPHDHK